MSGWHTPCAEASSYHPKWWLSPSLPQPSSFARIISVTPRFMAGAKHPQRAGEIRSQVARGRSHGTYEGHHSEERQPARFSVLRRLQLHNILPSIYLNPFLTIPHFYPFTFNSNPQAILKGWAAAWWHRPSSTGHLRVPQQCSDKLASCTWSWIRGLQS